jgi:hypothetical protein
MNSAIRRQLPKAPLFNIEWSRRSLRFAKFRLANSVRLHAWHFVLHFRAPWLEGPARAYYPQLFPQESTNAK